MKSVCAADSNASCDTDVKCGVLDNCGGGGDGVSGVIICSPTLSVTRVSGAMAAIATSTLSCGSHAKPLHTEHKEHSTNNMCQLRR